MIAPSVIFMGSKPGAVAALSILLERGWDVRCVAVCQDQAHQWIGGETLDHVARRAGVPVRLQSQLLDLPAVDFVISYMHRHRVKTPVLKLAERAAVNFHPAPLPEFGGWAFYNVAILEQRDEYEVTCHHMDDGFDSGPLVKARRFPMNPAIETAWSLERKSQREMVRLFVDFVDLAESGLPLPSQPQDRSRMRYFTREQFEALKEIPANADLQTVQRHARAFFYPPYPGAFMRINGAKIEVLPDIVKDDLACLLHARDHADLLAEAQRANLERSA